MNLAISPVPNQQAEPPSFFCEPIQWICQKVKQIAETIFGYLLRICYFQMGEFEVPGAYYIMRAYQKLMSDPREELPFDPVRLQRSKQLLESFGGVEATLTPADGNAQVKCMTLTPDKFFLEIDRLGGEKMEIIHQGERRQAIVPKSTTSPEQASILREKLAKFYLPAIPISINGQTIEGILLPHAPQSAQPPLVLRCHSPGRSMYMDRKFIGLHLAAGYPICIWDYRGTVESKGTASEGGYYLDAEAVYEHVKAQGYQPHHIWVSGMCAGAAVAAHLKAKYHDEGIHFVSENGFHSLRALINNHGWFGRFGVDYAIPGIQAKEPEITDRVQQDGFDLEHKFTQLKKGPGKFLIISTDTDTTVPQDSPTRMVDLAHRASHEIHYILRQHPKQNTNGHTQPPIEDPKVWNRYIQVVT